MLCESCKLIIWEWILFFTDMKEEPNAKFISSGFGGQGTVEIPCVFVTSIYDRGERLALIRWDEYGFGEMNSYKVIPKNKLLITNKETYCHGN